MRDIAPKQGFSLSSLVVAISAAYNPVNESAHGRHGWKSVGRSLFMCRDSASKLWAFGVERTECTSMIRTFKAGGLEREGVASLWGSPVDASAHFQRVSALQFFPDPKLFIDISDFPWLNQREVSNSQVIKAHQFSSVPPICFSIPFTHLLVPQPGRHSSMRCLSVNSSRTHTRAL
jgi:hypothetical protein